MKIFRSAKEFITDEKTSIVTIGTFDGVHIGHKEIIKNLIENAHRKNDKSVILTFFPHPRMVIQKGSRIKLLTTLEEKVALLEKSGLDYLIVQQRIFEINRLRICSRHFSRATKNKKISHWLRSSFWQE